MPRFRIAFVLLLSLCTGACSWFMHEPDEDAVKLAQDLLAAQKDQYGDPRPVDLPIQINYSVSRKPQVDQELKIEFQFIATQAIPVLHLGFTTSDGLKLVSSDVLERYQKLKPRQTFSKTIVVEPSEENEFHLNLYVVTESGQTRLAKLIKIPIAIGDFALKNNGDPGR